MPNLTTRTRPAVRVLLILLRDARGRFCTVRGVPVRRPVRRARARRVRPVLAPVQLALF